MTRPPSTATLRLRADLRVEPGRIADPVLRRMVKLGPEDGTLVERLIHRKNIEPADFPRLSALAKLYLLDGPRSRARLALERERAAFLALPSPGESTPLHWPPGRAPARHQCVGTGTCCSASFLGPVFPADQKRLSSLAFGRARRFEPGDRPWETVAFRGNDVVGMERDAEGQCVLQGPDLLCEVHLAHGLAAKPVTCRQFPLRFHQTPDGVQVSLLLACDGYDRARDAAGPWPEREAEIHGLLAEHAATVRIHVPVLLSAGLPVPWPAWLELRGACYAVEPDIADAETWLTRVLGVVDAAVRKRATALGESPELTEVRDGARLLRFVREPTWMLTGEFLDFIVAELVGDDRATTPRDRQRHASLVAGVSALGARLDWDLRAQQHLHDIVGNDLAAAVIVGELDAGLAMVALRVIVGRGVAQALAMKAGRTTVLATDTTHALHVVYRSEPELAWLRALLDL